jgi:LacI family transcriptional regulator
MSVTIKEVAKLAGVSASTVSRVMSKDVRISEATKDKVLECIKKLDYKVNNIARSLKTNKSHSIGFICPELTNEFFMNIATGVEDELRKFGYSMIVCNSNESTDNEEECLKLLYEKCVDGVIIIPSTNQGQHFGKSVDPGIPVVFVDRMVDGFAADVVLVDNINGAYSIVEYLIKEGDRRIGFIGGDLKITPAHERYAGYKRALEDYHIPVEENIIKFGDFHTGSGYKLMGELMEQSDPPSIVFIANYFMHIGATKYLIDNNGQLRFSVSIASFDDMELSSILGFSRLTVVQPMHEMGVKTAQLLLSRINGDDIPFPQTIRLKTSIKVKARK